MPGYQDKLANLFFSFYAISSVVQLSDLLSVTLKEQSLFPELQGSAEPTRAPHGMYDVYLIT
jgi:hypothetical protein